MFVGTAYQLQAASAIKAVSVAGSSLSLSNKMKTLGVVLGSRLTLESHVSSVIQSCNYHATVKRATSRL